MTQALAWSLLSTIDPNVTAGMIAAAVSIASVLWFDRRAHTQDLDADYRHAQRGALLALTGKYHGGLVEHATSWNYRMLNLFANVEERWLKAADDYSVSPQYYFHSTLYRFLALLSLAQRFEAEEIFIDARYVEAREIEFVKFTKAFHWVMSDVALFDGLPYDRGDDRDHFMSDRLRAMCEAFLTDDGVIPTFRGFETAIVSGSITELQWICRFFDDLCRDEPRYRWDRIVCLHLLTTAFVARFGYDWQKPTGEFVARAVSELQHPQVLQNFVAWLPKLGLEDQACLTMVKDIAKSAGAPPRPNP